MVSSTASFNWCYNVFSSYHIFPEKYNFKQLTNCSSQHFANTHQRLHLRQNIFCNQSLQYTAVLDCMEALIAKLYLVAKQFVFLFCLFLGHESWCVLTNYCKLKYILKFHFVPAIGWTTAFSCIIQCCELRQLWKGSAEQNVVSRAFYIATKSSKYRRNKRGSYYLSLYTNYDCFIPLSFIHFKIQYTLWCKWLRIYVNECHFPWKKKYMLIERDKSVNECRLNKINVFLR